MDPPPDIESKYRESTFTEFVDEWIGPYWININEYLLRRQDFIL
jgi:hypothetical protein